MPQVSWKGRAVAAALVLAALAWYVGQNAQHQSYAMGYTVGTVAAAVETWSLPLPAGYELLYWKSTPGTARDGIRVFQRDPAR